ncbi:recombinase family protein [Desulfopila sp. IMCC35006]|uniref:recombinase family protein n=1 Tax=Desulfopila sp. IMCC35006 TaxID=2569542 RepID=UPI0010AD4DB3|nr:recombinase family protein [Desulfopila sp. IMCC35006]TKB25980.1 recombinase family protein [Desulfopila sp. IMCC35006]
MKCYSYVRFSSAAQAAGKSLERQVETARKFAQEMNWEMDESLCMHDLGLSGFHAVHKEKGELGVFLQAIKENKIPVPSALIVENLDRLSRESVPDALIEFLNILRAGITIVTLMDKQIYDQSSIKGTPYQLFGSIMIMARAHEESDTKGKRRTDTWNRAKKEARDGKKIKARNVAWLKLDEKNNKFIEISEHVDSIRRIYDLYIQGHGVETICKILNQEKRKTFHKITKSWANTTVNRLLTTRAVLGEIQFMKTSAIEHGKRKMIEDGKVIKDYYPAIIDEDTFYEAQAIRKSKGGQFGKIGQMKNIFSLKARCGYCGGSMSYGTRGRKRFQYLYCNNAKKGICNINQMFSFRYDHLEEAFLNCCKRLELRDIVNDKQSIIQANIKNLKVQINTINSKIQESEENVKKLKIALTSGSEATIEFFTESINEEFSKQKELKNTHTELQAELLAQENLQGCAEVNLETLKTVIQQMNSTDEGTRLDTRRKLQKAIRLLIDEIKIYPVGKQYKTLMEDPIFSERYEMEKIGKANFSRMFSKFKEVEVLFNGGGSLRLVHDYQTEGMKLFFETDKKGILTKETIEELKKNPNVTEAMIEVLKGKI